MAVSSRSNRCWFFIDIILNYSVVLQCILLVGPALHVARRLDLPCFVLLQLVSSLFVRYRLVSTSILACYCYFRSTNSVALIVSGFVLSACFNSSCLTTVFFFIVRLCHNSPQPCRVSLLNHLLFHITNGM